MATTSVLKFGSSVLASPDALSTVVHTVYRHLRAGERVVAVVSALDGATDRLARLARSVHDPGSPAADRAHARLLATGELQSVALLGLALERAGLPATLLDAGSLQLRTRGTPLDAEPVSVDREALTQALDATGLVVVPGFVGRAADGSVSVLGRGGSDLTAVFLAAELGADCVLYKDVDGLYERDPKIPGPAPGRYARLSWADAQELDACIVQPRAIAEAARRRLRFRVAAPGCPAVSVVGGACTEVEDPHAITRPLRVTLLGLGTVGGGVCAELLARPDDFDVVAAAVRGPGRYADHPLGPRIHASARAALAVDTDVVVELMGGVSAGEAVEAALRRGRHVVTANKALLAQDGPRLRGVAAAHGVSLLGSASVGGALPALETASRLRGVTTGFAGVLNGTCNHVLDAVGRGVPFADAVRAAQAAGFAEADPSADLDGLDAAHKLVLLARACFGAEPLASLSVTGIRGLAGPPPGRVWRLVARCRRTDGALHGSVRPEALPARHALADVRGAGNRLVFTTPAGTVSIGAQGAGRWPTTESVFADLLDLLHGRRTPVRRRRAS